MSISPYNISGEQMSFTCKALLEKHCLIITGSPNQTLSRERKTATILIERPENRFEANQEDETSWKYVHSIRFDSSTLCVDEEVRENHSTHYICCGTNTIDVKMCG